MRRTLCVWRLYISYLPLLLYYLVASAATASMFLLVHKLLPSHASLVLTMITKLHSILRLRLNASAMTDREQTRRPQHRQRLNEERQARSVAQPAPFHINAPYISDHSTMDSCWCLLACL